MSPYVLSSSEDPPLPSLLDQSSPSGNLSSLLAGKRVVIVEDEGITQMHLRRILKNAGLTVLTSAVNGEMGVETVLRERPDLVLMDIKMPVMDGLEASERILAEYSVCIVVLTAFSEEEYRQRAQELGTSGYVLKPIITETLLPALEAAYHKFHHSPFQQ
jgi:two-component system, response regulator PdtaR